MYNFIFILFPYTNLIRCDKNERTIEFSCRKTANKSYYLRIIARNTYSFPQKREMNISFVSYSDNICLIVFTFVNLD